MGERCESRENSREAISVGLWVSPLRRGSSEGSPVLEDYVLLPNGTRGVGAVLLAGVNTGS